jgi:hypothetical protein
MGFGFVQFVLDGGDIDHADLSNAGAKTTEPRPREQPGSMSVAKADGG